jgi:folate-binding protein YgfZ
MSTTFTSIPSAVAMPYGGIDDGLAWHYGDPFAEQRLLASGEGTVDISNRGVISLSGPDRLTFLNSLTTQAIDQLPAGSSTITLDLNPNGFILHELHLVDDGEIAWLTCEPTATATLVTYFNRMKFRSLIEVTDVTSEWAVLFQAVAEPHPDFVTWVTPQTDRWAAREILVPRAEAAAIVAAAPAGVWAWSALRVAAGIPRQGFETDHHTIPHELGWIGPAVHLNKGCYRGQETVSKVARMGKPPRRLTLLHLDGSVDEMPQAGLEVTVDGVVVGFLGTAVQHYELGPIALAVIKRNVDAAATVQVANMNAQQEVLVEI